MIRISPRLKYLPRFRFEYTPYGPELVNQNYFKLDLKLIQINFSHSDATFTPSWRVWTCLRFPESQLSYFANVI